jgi:phosphate butyryltransferase
MPIETLDQLVARAQTMPQSCMVVVAAHDPEVLRSVEEAHKQGISSAILVGNAHQIEEIARQGGLDLSGARIEDVPDERQAATRAMALIREGSANIAVKGQVKTTTFLRAALDRERGIRDRKLLSHVGLFEIPAFDRLLYMSDSGVVLYPTPMQKCVIIQSVIDVAHRLGLEQPRVAILAANEQVHPSRPGGVEALLLARMAAEGWITGALVDGPMPLDLALYPRIAQIKRVSSAVAGQADIVIVPNVEAGNMAAKAIQYIGHGEMAGLVIGAQVPILINSRADDALTRLRSVAMAALLAHRKVAKEKANGS